MMPPTLSDRLRAGYVVDSATGCWIWQRAKDGHGYGQIWAEGRLHGTHRVAYSIMVAPIPSGLELDHLCRNRACCNPDHLEAVSHAVNIKRSPTAPPAINASKTHCIRGHEFNDTNSYHRKDRPGRKQCLACRREARKRGAA